MRYTGKLFYPRGAKLLIDVQDLSPIQGQPAYRLYARFKRAMDEDQFNMTVDAGSMAQPVMLQFRRIEQTAGFAAFVRHAENEIERLDAVVAILPRLDPDEDEAVLNQLQGSPHLSMIEPDDWADARQESGPLAAAFFANEASLNDPLIHGLMSLVGAAFLDRLGLLEG